MSRITVEDAARLWHEASDDELRDLAAPAAPAGTSRIARRTW